MGRRTLANASWDECFDYLIFVSLSLRVAAEDGDKDVAPLRPTVDKLLQRWDELSAERRQRRTAQLLANVKVKRRDQQGDGTVQALHDDALALARQNRDEAFFRRLFPAKVSELIRLSLPGELPEWKELLRRLGEAETPIDLKNNHTAALTAAIAQGEAALAEREVAYSAAGQTAARVEGFREDADRALQGIEAALLLLQSKRRLPSAWLDSFFPSPAKSKKKKGKEPEPPTVMDPPPAPESAR